MSGVVGYESIEWLVIFIAVQCKSKGASGSRHTNFHGFHLFAVAVKCKHLPLSCLRREAFAFVDTLAMGKLLAKAKRM